MEFDHAKAALSKLAADDLVMVQARAPAGANSSTTSGFASRMLDAKTPPALYYHDADGIGAVEAEWYAPGDEPGFGDAMMDLLGDSAWRGTFTFRVGHPTEQAPPSPRRAFGDVVVK